MTLTVMVLAEHLEGLTSDDAAVRAASLEALTRYRSNFGMVWMAILLRLWLQGSPAAAPGRRLVGDEQVPSRVRGVIGSVRTVTVGGNVLVFFTVLDAGSAELEYGPLMAWGTRTRSVATSGTTATHEFAIDQPDPAARAARPGGLRPRATLVDPTPSTGGDPTPTIADGPVPEGT